MIKSIRLSLIGNIAEISRAAEAVEKFCSDNGLPPQLAFDLNLAVDELATNTISYGFAARNGDGKIELSIALLENDLIEVRLDDNGVPYDPFTQTPPPVLDADVDSRPIGGLGVYFVQKLMDETSYRRDGDWNRLTLRRAARRGECRGE